jgi:hypothetical protein
MHHRRHRHRHRRRDPAPRPRFQLSPPFARIVLGGTVAIAVLSAGALVFGPFSDLSVLQLAAGPHAHGASSAPASVVVLAHTARAWGADAQQRQTGAASSVPITRIARRDTHGP